MKKRRGEDWLMFLFILPIALLGPILLYFGAKDNEEQKLKEMENAADTADYYDVNTLRQIHKELLLENGEDSLHFFEDGM